MNLTNKHNAGWDFSKTLIILPAKRLDHLPVVPDVWLQSWSPGLTGPFPPRIYLLCRVAPKEVCLMYQAFFEPVTRISICTWFSMIKWPCIIYWLGGESFKSHKHSTCHQAGLPGIWAQWVIESWSPGLRGPSPKALPTLQGWVYCLVPEVYQKGECQWNKAFFWSSHARVSFCMWLPTIKQPTIIYRLGRKSVKSLNILPATRQDYLAFVPGG